MATILRERYELYDAVGSGAAGRVFRARDLRLDRDVAVKRLRADALSGSDARARFGREALALARVSDPHVLGILDVSTDPHDFFLVTDYCDGGSLADRLRAGRMMIPDVRSLAREASAGLAAIHAAGIIHRDVKPSNILRLAGRWVIGDFGIARLDGDATLTQTGAVIGTPDYWAPETARGERATQAVDIYSLGCVLYEALAGQPVFRGDTPLATGLLHVTAEMPQLPAETQRADPRLSALVTRMLDKHPAGRPTASAINQELNPGVPDDTLQYPEVPTQVMPSPSAATAATRRFTDQRPEKRRRPLVTLLVIGVLLVVAALGAFALSRRGDATSGPAGRTGSTAGHLADDDSDGSAARGQKLGCCHGRTDPPAIEDQRRRHNALARPTRLGRDAATRGQRPRRLRGRRRRDAQRRPRPNSTRDNHPHGEGPETEETGQGPRTRKPRTRPQQ